MSSAQPETHKYDEASFQALIDSLSEISSTLEDPIQAKGYQITHKVSYIVESIRKLTEYLCYSFIHKLDYFDQFVERDVLSTCFPAFLSLDQRPITI